MTSRLWRRSPLLYVTLLLPGCYQRQAFYVSPFNGNTGNYHVQPRLQDSARSGMYIDGAYFGGQANDDHTDHFKGGSLSVYRSHHGRFLQGYYGLDLTLAGFTTGKWDTVPNTTGSRRDGPPQNARQLNSFQGSRYFGGLGFDGGVNFVLPMGSNGGEWRFLGLETSLRREFGDYLAFRQTIPDTAATLIARHNFYATIGLTTELVGRAGEGDFGLKVGHGWVLGGDYNYLGLRNNAANAPLRFYYTSFTLHFTKGRYTGILQSVFATKANSGRLGFSYRLNRSRPNKLNVLR